MTLAIRVARPGDVGAIMELLHALAENEGEPDAVKATPDSLAQALFADPPLARAQVAVDGETVVGLALYYTTYSTWTGKPGLYLEDFVLAPQARGQGAGRALFAALAREARALDCARIDWAVMDGNEAARAFYAKIGAHHSTGWAPWRLDGEALDVLAQG